MDALRTPFFVVALVLSVLTVLLEVGSLGVHTQFSAADFSSAATSAGVDSLGDDASALHDQESPPGLGVPYLALLDGVVLFTIAIAGAGILVPRSLEGRIQGLATLIFSIVLIFAAIALIFAAIAKLILMVSLLFSFPFGTLAYMAIFGFFNRGATSAALSVLMLLKLGFAISLVLAQQRFLQNVGLVLLVITALVGNVVVSFLQALVPILLVSITDDIAGIIVAILAVIWAIILLIGSIPAIVKALKPSTS